MTAECVLDARATLGEGSIWDYRRAILVWVDIENGIVNEYDPASGVNTPYSVGQRVGTVVPTTANRYILGLERGIGIFDPVSGAVEIVADPESDNRDNRMNDGKCDPRGRFWVGSMSLSRVREAGALYRMEGDFTVTRVIERVTTSNGIVWTGDRMYYIDTPTGVVREYTYDEESGDVAYVRDAVTMPDEAGRPDGMTIDADGKLWVAGWGGACVTRWDPATGKLLDRVDVASSNVTSCAFGGADLGTLFITTARIGVDEAGLARRPQSGGLFAVRPGVVGRHAAFFPE